MPWSRTGQSAAPRLSPAHSWIAAETFWGWLKPSNVQQGRDCTFRTFLIWGLQGMLSTEALESHVTPMPDTRCKLLYLGWELPHQKFDWIFSRFHPASTSSTKRGGELGQRPQGALPRGPGLHAEAQERDLYTTGGGGGCNGVWQALDLVSPLLLNSISTPAPSL